LGRGKIREAKLQEEVDPEVGLLFDRLWEALLDVTEDVVDYGTKAVLEEMSQELGDAIAEELMYDEDTKSPHRRDR
jgi:hypothetical protein